MGCLPLRSVEVDFRNTSADGRRQRVPFCSGRTGRRSSTVEAAPEPRSRGPLVPKAGDRGSQAQEPEPVPPEPAASGPEAARPGCLEQAPHFSSEDGAEGCSQRKQVCHLEPALPTRQPGRPHRHAGAQRPERPGLQTDRKGSTVRSAECPPRREDLFGLPSSPESTRLRASRERGGWKLAGGPGVPAHHQVARTELRQREMSGKGRGLRSQ